MKQTQGNGKTEAGKSYTRRELLASMGAAGLLMSAAGTGLGGGLPHAEAAPAGGGWGYNVKDYGAQGNGRYDQDDAPAIQAALDAAGERGGTVFIPAGRYMLKTGLRIRSHVHVRGEGAGASIVKSMGIDVVLFSSHSSAVNCSIEGLTLEGFGAVSGSKAALLAERGIHVLEGQQWLIRHCVFQQLANGIHLTRSKQITVTECSFQTMLGEASSPHEGHALLAQGGRQLLIAHNGFRRVFRQAVKLTDGCSGSLISGNLIDSCEAEAILIASETVPCADNLLQGNIISGDRLTEKEFSCTVGIRLDGYVTNHQISGNRIAHALEAGIVVASAGTSEEEKPSGHLMQGNQIEGCPKGISLLNGDDNVIAGNDIRRTAVGVELDAAGDGAGALCRRNAVTHNTFLRFTEAAVQIGASKGEHCTENRSFGNSGSGAGELLIDRGKDTVREGF